MSRFFFRISQVDNHEISVNPPPSDFESFLRVWRSGTSSQGRDPVCCLLHDMESLYNRITELAEDLKWLCSNLGYAHDLGKVHGQVESSSESVSLDEEELDVNSSLRMKSRTCTISNFDYSEPEVKQTHWLITDYCNPQFKKQDICPVQHTTTCVWNHTMRTFVLHDPLESTEYCHQKLKRRPSCNFGIHGTSSDGSRTSPLRWVQALQYIADVGNFSFCFVFQEAQRANTEFCTPCTLLGSTHSISPNALHVISTK